MSDWVSDQVSDKSSDLDCCTETGMDLAARQRISQDH